MNITLCLYAHSPEQLHRSLHLAQEYAPFFSNTLVINNSTERPLHPSPFILQLPDVNPLYHGAMLNHAITHINSGLTFLVDARSPLNHDTLYRLSQLELSLSCPAIVGFEHQRHLGMDGLQQQLTPWRNHLSFANILGWGGLLFDTAYLIAKGGFTDCLSFDALIIDLCLRLEKTDTILLQHSCSLSHLSSASLAISKKEQAYLRKKYPQHFPSLLSQLFSWYRKDSSPKTISAQCHS